MSSLRRSLFLKLQIAIGVVGFLCVALLGFQLYANARIEAIDTVYGSTIRKQGLIERTNGLVYAVVMESRGLYMAETPQRIDQFGSGLLRQLEALKKTVALWESRLEAAELADFEAFKKQNDAFIRLRSELVAEARRAGSSAARAVGDNEANRSVRTAFNASIDRLAKVYDARVVELDAERQALQQQTRIVGVIITCMALAAIALLWAWIMRRMSGPFREITRHLDRLAAGDTSAVVSGIGREDEVGAIARAVEAFRQGAVEKVRLDAEADAESDARKARHAQLEGLIASFQSAAAGRVATLAQTSADLNQAAASLSTGAEETARQAEIVTEASQEITTNFETLANASQELSGAIGEIANGIGQANEVAERAAAMKDATTAKFADLAQAVSKIGAVADLINSIAGQTNLLALNATIEAARAGEAGRGFAVVASEVKQLAAQTTQATADITANIANVQAVTTESVSAVEMIGTTIEEMRRIALEVSAAIEQQRVATGEIANNVQNASNGTEQVSLNIFGVSQAADETGVAAMKVLQSASRVSSESEEIRREVEGFLAGVRAA